MRKYDLLYSLNQYKFNKLVFLPILSNILYKIIGKKIEYNIINLKSIAYNTDLFTNALALKLRKKRINYIYSMFSILNRAYLPNINTIKERSLIKGNEKMDPFHEEYKDLKVISNLNTNNLDNLLEGIYPSNIKKLNSNHSDSESSKNIHNIIYNSVGYKNMGGIRLEVKGRLTKRYRADRAVHYKKWKGGLQKTSLHSTLFRGNVNPNISYSIANNTRRVGSFAIKGWISGK